MNILIVSHYFYPEDFKVNDIAFDFAKQGHNVTVLTGKPNYPHGRFFKGYNFFNKRKEIINGVTVIRTPLIPRFDSSGKYLIINYLSFLFFAFFAVTFRVRGNYDVIFGISLSPMTSVLPGVWLKRKFKAPLVLWILDLWPDSVISNTDYKGGVVINTLNKIINHIYKNADKVLISSKSFKQSIVSKFKVAEEKIMHFPNWAEDVFTSPDTNSEVEIPVLPEGFNVMFAGNLGESQDFEAVVEAAKMTKDEVNWIIVGDGRKADWIKEKKSEFALDNMYLLGRYPLETMPAFFAKADAMLVSLRDDPTFASTVPGKVQAYMGSGKVILGMLPGEGKELINESGCGLAVAAGDYEGLVANALKIKNLTAKERQEIEDISLQFYKDYFSKEMLFAKLEEVFKSAQLG